MDPAINIVGGYYEGIEKVNFADVCSFGVEGSTCMSDDFKKKLKSTKIPNYKKEDVERITAAGRNEDELNLLLAASSVIPEDEIINEYKRFSAVGPTDTSLFNNFVEDQVLSRINNYIPSFYHVPVQLMDFSHPTHTFNTKLRELVQDIGPEIGKKYKTFGCILNTLRSTGSLSKVGHWVAMFGDFRRKDYYSIEYFNSSGRDAEPDAFKWMEKTAKEIQKLTGKKTIAVNVSNIKHQKSNTECGAYSAYFIIYRQFGGEYKDFRAEPISDELMTKFRSKILISEKKITPENLQFLKSRRLV